MKFQHGYAPYTSHYLYKKYVLTYLIAILFYVDTHKYTIFCNTVSLYDIYYNCCYCL